MGDGVSFLFIVFYTWSSNTIASDRSKNIQGKYFHIRDLSSLTRLYARYKVLKFFN